MKTAILVDAAFFLKRGVHTLGWGKETTPSQWAQDLHLLARQHLKKFQSEPEQDLYRIFVYDAPPSEKTISKPVSRSNWDLGKTATYQRRLTFHKELLKLRKVALRLGRLDNHTTWVLRSHVISDLLGDRKQGVNLQDEDFYPNIKQKQVDMKLGLDIASLAYKSLVERIVLVAGDRDFVPAAKLARREGIDFILDPMGHGVSDDLLEHIDGLFNAHVALERMKK